jgi:serine/threonine protein kinase
MERFDPDQPIPDTLTLKVSDFGLARPLFGDSSLTRSDQIVGTPAYMSPEQARSEHRQLGPASDVYSIGVVLYEFLVNRPPLVADNALETLRLITDVEPVPPRRIRQGISRDLDTICMKCLQKKPSERYASAAELADDLQRLLENRPIKARPIGPVHRLYRWCQRNPAMAALFFVLLITITAITYLSLHVSLIENQLRLEAETRSLITEKANQQATVNQAEIEIRDVITLQSTGLCKECIKILSRIIQQALLSKPGEPNFTQWQSLGNRASYLLAKQKLILNDNADAIKILTAAQKQFRLVPDLSRYSRLQILERHILLDLLREKLDKKESVVLIKEIDGEIESLKASREKTVIQN